MKKIVITIAIVTAACTPEREKTVARAKVQPIPKVHEKISGKVESPLKNQNVSASSRVSALSQDSKIHHRYLFMDSIATRGKEVEGRVDVASNPFVQFALSSESLKRDDLKTFIKKAHEAHDKGEIGGAQWAAFVAAEQAYKLTGSTFLITKVQTSAMNSKVAATFPGVLGGVNPIKASLPLLWIRKFDGGIDPTNTDVSRVFASSLPLIGNEDLYEDMRESLSAAIQSYPLNPNLSDNERASSFVLFHRMFAQLLTLKGYTAAKYGKVDGKSAIPSLTDKMQSFDSASKVGYFIDVKANTPVALTTADITNYDPSKRFLLLGSGGANVASMATEVSFMRAMALAFEASSPAAYFVKDANSYIFGDVQSPANRAIIPGEAHSLALGLFAMELRNFAALHLAYVNEEGKDISVVGGEAAGISIHGQLSGHEVSELEIVLRMIELNLQLESAIEAILAKHNANPEQLKVMNSFYPAAIGSLLDLQDKLKALRLPLYILTKQFVKADRDLLFWSPKTGFEVPTGNKLSGDKKQRVGFVLRDLAVEMNQPMIFEDAEAILAGKL